VDTPRIMTERTRKIGNGEIQCARTMCKIQQNMINLSQTYAGPPRIDRNDAKPRVCVLLRIHEARYLLTACTAAAVRC